jgi:sigma-B regulation protein RsbU (phosphoserine phosphatase)
MALEASTPDANARQKANPILALHAAAGGIAAMPHLPPPEAVSPDALPSPARPAPFAGRAPEFALLQSHNMLRGIPAGVLQALVEKCRTITLDRNEVLLTPGEENHTLYFLLSGQLEVHLDSRDSGNSFPIYAGEVIGEMSIIEERPVSAWVVGEQPSQLLAMPEQVFWSHFVSIPQATRNLLQLLISRVRRTDAVLAKELERKVRYEHLQRELESAAKIQASILPGINPMFPKHPQVDAHAVIKPAREVGGDFFDALALNDHCLCVAVGDVCGKGLAAALFMVRVITLLRVCLLREHNPAAVLPAVNRLLCEANEEAMFVTLAVVLFDTRTGRLTYLNGGHNPPLLSVCAQPFAPWQPPKGKALGVEPQAAFSTSEFVLQPGDTLVLYTDGVTEAENERHEQFNVARAAKALSQAIPYARVIETVANLERAIGDFTGDAPQSDDITVLALRYQGDLGDFPHV